MRSLVMMVLPLLLDAGAVLAQTRPAPAASPAGPRPAGQSTGKDNIAECMRLWDAQTHMTKQQWSATCKRIQSRLDNLKIDNLDPSPKATRKKKGS